MAELDGRIATWTATLPCGELLELPAAHGVPAGRVYTAPDMLVDYAARNMVHRAPSRAGHVVPMAGIVPAFSRTPGAVRDVGPSLGGHTAEVLDELAVPDG
jgi:succinyl-CoA---D-citramalate CoA-transferase